MINNIYLFLNNGKFFLKIFIIFNKSINSDFWRYLNIAFFFNYMINLYMPYSLYAE